MDDPERARERNENLDGTRFYRGIVKSSLCSKYIPSECVCVGRPTFPVARFSFWWQFSQKSCSRQLLSFSSFFSMAQTFRNPIHCAKGKILHDLVKE